MDWLIKDASAFCHLGRVKDAGPAATCHLDWLALDFATDSLMHSESLLESGHVLFGFFFSHNAAFFLSCLLHLG